MVSWLEEIERREAAARAEISELRSRMEELAGRLAEREAVLSRLEITRETMTEILSGNVRGQGEGAAAASAPGLQQGVREHRQGTGLVGDLVEDAGGQRALRVQALGGRRAGDHFS
jgi:chromosome segregation ATPase